MTGKEKIRAANAGPKPWQLVSAALVFFLLVPLSAQMQSHPHQFDLSLILEKTGEYCRRLASASLDFVCQEEIKERLYYSPYAKPMYLGGRFYRENRYLYDYQLIRKSGQMLEKRILLEENGKKKIEADAELKTKQFEHKYVIFGPVGLLSPENQLYLSYQIEKEAKLGGENVVIIDAKPKNPEDGSRLYGKVWIREGDFSILKIEWDQSSMGNIEGIMEIAEKLKAKAYITFVSEYGYEKNGIRFPSKYSVVEEYIIGKERRSRIRYSHTAVTYKNYKFFTVETQVKY
jgi:hypothetical protein